MYCILKPLDSLKYQEIWITKMLIPSNNQITKTSPIIKYPTFTVQITKVDPTKFPFSKLGIWWSFVWDCLSAGQKFPLQKLLIIFPPFFVSRIGLKKLCLREKRVRWKFCFCKSYVVTFKEGAINGLTELWLDRNPSSLDNLTSGRRQMGTSYSKVTGLKYKGRMTCVVLLARCIT